MRTYKVPAKGATQTAAYEVRLRADFRRLWCASGLAAVSLAHPPENPQEAPQESSAAASFADSGEYALSPDAPGDTELSA